VSAIKQNGYTFIAHTINRSSSKGQVLSCSSYIQYDRHAYRPTFAMDLRAILDWKEQSGPALQQAELRQPSLYNSHYRERNELVQYTQSRMPHISQRYNGWSSSSDMRRHAKHGGDQSTSSAHQWQQQQQQQHGRRHRQNRHVYVEVYAVSDLSRPYSYLHVTSVCLIISGVTCTESANSVIGGGSVGECGRVSQRSWLVGAL